MTTFVINIHSPRFFCSPLYLFKQKNRNPERERERKLKKGQKGLNKKIGIQNVLKLQVYDLVFEVAKSHVYGGIKIIMINKSRLLSW